MKRITYSIVVPVYNEEEVIDEMYRRTTKVMQRLGEPYEIIVINDGSRDNTLPIVKRIQKSDPNVKILSLSRNFGHQVAITAGLERTSGDAVVVIDADLQDPPELIVELAEKWKEGYDVVYARREKREGESVFKKTTASAFYVFLRSIARVDLPRDVGDFRLLSRRVVESLRRIRERHRFVRGLVNWIGYKQIAVSYVRHQRFAGDTSYSFWKMLRFAFDGIASFSYIPLRLATILGVTISLFSFLAIVFSAFVYFAEGGHSVFPEGGIPTLAMMLMGGIQLVFLGLIGEYIGRIYDEVKNRPLYLLDEEIGFDTWPHE